MPSNPFMFRAGAVCAVASSLMLAGCGGGDKAAPQPTQTGPALPGQSTTTSVGQQPKPIGSQTQPQPIQSQTSQASRPTQQQPPGQSQQPKPGAVVNLDTFRGRVQSDWHLVPVRTRKLSPNFHSPSVTPTNLWFGWAPGPGGTTTVGLWDPTKLVKKYADVPAGTKVTDGTGDGAYGLWTTRKGNTAQVWSWSQRGKQLMQTVRADQLGRTGHLAIDLFGNGRWVVFPNGNAKVGTLVARNLRLLDKVQPLRVPDAAYPRRYADRDWFVTMNGSGAGTRYQVNSMVGGKVWSIPLAATPNNGIVDFSATGVYAALQIRKTDGGTRTFVVNTRSVVLTLDASVGISANPAIGGSLLFVNNVAVQLVPNIKVTKIQAPQGLYRWSRFGNVIGWWTNGSNGATAHLAPVHAPN